MTHNRRQAPSTGPLVLLICTLASLAQCGHERGVERHIDHAERDRTEALAKIEGGLGRDDVRDTVRDNIEGIRGCYHAALDKQPNLQGSVTVAAQIATSGRVTSSTLADSNVKDTELETCIVDTFARWQFPKGAAPTEVRYPFALAVD